MGFNLAIPLRAGKQTKLGGLYTEADPRSLPAGASPQCWDVDFLISGVGTRPGQTQAASGFTGNPNSFYTSRLGDVVETIVGDSAGKLYAENQNTSPGTFTPIYSGILNNARALSENAFNRELICLSDLSIGQDQPRQWDGTNLDRITQCGPGAGPIAVSQGQAAQNTYPIAASPNGVYQPFPKHQIDGIVWSGGSNTGAPGNILTVFGYPFTTDPHFADALNPGDTIYMWNTLEIDNVNLDGTYTVLTVGLFNFDSADRYFFTVQAKGSGTGQRYNWTTAYYQKTASLVQLTKPVPADQAGVGSTIVLSGVGVPQWNGTYKVIDTPQEGQLLISSTSLTGNVATYDYSLVSGQAPGWQANTAEPPGAQITDANGNVWQVQTPGVTGNSIPAFPASPTYGTTTQTDGTAPTQITWLAVGKHLVTVTVFNTSNGNGIFNVQSAVILSATQTTFTVAITSPNIAGAGEQGEAVSGTGTSFLFDPGAQFIGTGTTNPIFTASGGGVLITQNSQVSAGQRYAILLFLMRSGAITPASPPVSFFTDTSTSSLEFTDLVIGPDAVLGRIVAITAANAGIGGPYYWIPTDVVLPASSLQLGKTITYQKTLVPDNATTTLTITNFSDTVLLAQTNVTTTGNNVFQMRELGECAKAVLYGGRVAYQGERAKVDNFTNLTFDGGYVSGSSIPAGWTLSAGTSAQVAIGTSPIYGLDVSITGAAMLQQTASQDAFKVPIIDALTAYSVRVIASGTGTLVVDLYDGTNSYAFTQVLTGTTTEYIGAFGNPMWQPVPSTLVLRFYLSGGTGSATLQRIEVFPTQEPEYATQLIVSYGAENPEGIDSQTGPIDISDYTNEPIRNSYKFLDSLYIKTDSKTFESNVGDGEPSTWSLREISNTVGSFGPLADDVGEEYTIGADKRGVYVFDGGNHIPISQDIQQIWDSIYQPSSKTVWVKNDLQQRRILVGVPLPTPNQWLPNAPSNPTPSSPNVILMCSYLGVIDGRQLGGEPAVHTSAFTGQLLWIDMRRKWTIWQIATPFGNWINRPDTSEQLWLGGTNAINKLDFTATTDVGAAIKSRYVTYDYSDIDIEQAMQAGPVRKLYGYVSALIEGSGSFSLTALPETINTPYSETQADFTLSNPALDDTNIPLNTSGNRVFFQFDSDGVAGTWWNLRSIAYGVISHPRIPVSGL